MKMASSSTLLGVFLAVSMFGAGVLAEKMTSVHITNLPVDEEGNLKVKVAEKPMQKLTDAVRVIALDTSSHQYEGNEYGVHFYYSSNLNLTLPFAFTPKEEFVNITDVWVTVTVIVFDYTDWKLDVVINDGEPVTSSVRWCYLTSLNQFSIHIEDPDISRSIDRGVNTLKVINPRRWTDGGWVISWCTAYRVTIDIEYEYQA